MAVGVLLAAGLFAYYPVQAMAEPAAGQDQYLEVVPGGGGDQSPKDFSRSLGGNGGPVTKQQIIALAKRNAARRGGAGRGGKDSSAGGRPGQTRPASDATALVTAAAKQPFSPSFSLAFGALLLLIALSGVWLRKRHAAR